MTAQSSSTTPLGRGLSASVENVGQRRRGSDGMYTVVADRRGQHSWRKSTAGTVTDSFAIPRTTGTVRGGHNGVRNGVRKGVRKEGTFVANPKQAAAKYGPFVEYEHVVEQPDGSYIGTSVYGLQAANGKGVHQWCDYNTFKTSITNVPSNQKLVTMVTDPGSVHRAWFGDLAPKDQPRY